MTMDRALGPEAARNYQRRLAEGFFAKYLSGSAILDIGYRGSNLNSVPIIENAIGVELDFPGYDGKHLPFPNESQDAVFASHSLEHIEAYREVLGDWYRVLKLGGFLIIAVPHRDLYERKACPPSRFNPDHKRFYTPSSLLTEIEESLPPGGYRIRSLRDIDDGFDYTIPPEQHACGCYEIELVLQKIAIPAYADRLRLSGTATGLVALFSAMLVQAVLADRSGQQAVLNEIQALLKQIPLPPLRLISASLSDSVNPEARRVTEDELVGVLKPVVQDTAFDETWYLTQYEDVMTGVAAGHPASAHVHFVSHGYWEGRAPTRDDQYPPLEN
jgi:hypothetical protein